MFQSLPDDIASALIRAGDHLGAFAGRVLWRDEVGSTNDIVLALAADGAGEGRVVVAGAQTTGRGRRGRAWVSPPGAGVYASALLRPASRALPLLTLASGIAVAEGIQAASGLEAAVKWPNDVCVTGPAGRLRKLAGILAEAAVSRDEAPHVVVGFGINVGFAAYPPDMAARATSIELELGRTVDRGLVLAECLAALWRRYQDLQDGRVDFVLDAWRQRARTTLGRRVEWDGANGAQSGIAVTVDDSGALLIRSASGDSRVVSGEVRWL
jgi:BirA family transcriptional regulator, biotin operon repressor / biotin---[acetyl-CoA-carboxylase] ligase